MCHSLSFYTLQGISHLRERKSWLVRRIQILRHLSAQSKLVIIHLALHVSLSLLLLVTKVTYKDKEIEASEKDKELEAQGHIAINRVSIALSPSRFPVSQVGLLLSFVSFYILVN